MIAPIPLPRVVKHVALASALALAPSALAQGPPAAVRVDAVRQEVVVNRRPVTGDLRAARRSQVASREKGLVLERAVDEGSRVRRGDVLARLDATQLELDLEVLEAERPPAEATVEEREADMQQRTSDLDSLKVLVERRAANPKELLDAQTALAASKARLQVSRALVKVIDSRVRKLEARIRDMTIVAPFDGTVVQSFAEVGSWLGEGQAVVDLLSTEALEVWLEVPQDLYRAATGASGAIQVSVGALGETFELSSYRVIPEVALRGRSFRVVGTVAPDLKLAAGMSVTALVPTGEERPMLTVHRDAILRNEVSAFVYAVLPGHEGEPAKAAPIDVQVQFQTANRAVVLSPRLRPGMDVVIEGNERLYPMAPILPARGAGGEPPAGGGEGPPKDGGAGR